MGFKSFLAANPAHRLTPDAIFYIGETYLQRSRPREAAEQYLKVTTDYAKSARAPESMVRLGQTLAALGNNEQACATLAEFGKRYPAAVRLGEEARRARDRQGSLLSAERLHALSAARSRRAARAARAGEVAADRRLRRSRFHRAPADGGRMGASGAERPGSRRRLSIMGFAPESAAEAEASPRSAGGSGSPIARFVWTGRQADDPRAGAGARGALPPARRLRAGDRRRAVLDRPSRRRSGGDGAVSPLARLGGRGPARHGRDEPAQRRHDRAASDGR